VAVVENVRAISIMVQITEGRFGGRFAALSVQVARPAHGTVAQSPDSAECLDAADATF
jgi:hypothetical protein